ncbi:phosphatidylinositol 4,5-bisphosphate-binding protein KNAG_0H02160 [Huiozyma naganishii CBS 8797]|uniref:PH domain-containing protein n=1 Tax=Huiozyma naganishii (strain ATCC MYA-139 / BCRC 22969 / CBS 8797 / KCTC 17520 / NBRC 10181 / NCYC 3082 / Yp74L-3) TaxID=1071383 RepID=J7R9T2_HUIN7|nr:hypothetical protein KNAG_0H02160 [Kazachstania naganishii CBS 8797]CCK71630.1 hypothetical protein KNAG_0H02160 [Kazachstania naganishii CBS 8797]
MSKHSTMTSGASEMKANLKQHASLLSPQQQRMHTASLAGSGETAHQAYSTRDTVSLPQHRPEHPAQDPRSPLVILVPTTAQPTEVLAARFAAWRSVIKSLLGYLSETASIQEEIVRQQLRLQHAVQFPFFAVENQSQPSSSEDKATQRFFLPLGCGSVQNVPSVLNAYHGALAAVSSKGAKELNNEVIPRLEELRRDLLVKIKEIKQLQSDFKNSCTKELSITKQELKQYWNALKECKFTTPAKDPYLLKITLDKQIKRQITEENYLHEAFDNLQTSGCELEKVVVMEIQNATTMYARILGQEAQLVFDILVSKLDAGFLRHDPQFEWDSFIARDNNFIPPNLPMRRFKEIVYKHQADPVTYEIRSGFLERRSKFLKSYSRGFYVLSANYLHEFKSADRKRDLVPVMSLALEDCSVAEHSKQNATEHKFILHAKQNGLIHRGHNWVFKVESHATMMAWFHDLKKFTTFDSIEDKTKYIVKRFAQQQQEKSSATMPQDNSRKSMEADTDADERRLSTSTTNTGTPPKLDTTTQTETTASIPDTGDHVPSFYIETASPEKSKAA